MLKLVYTSPVAPLVNSFTGVGYWLNSADVIFYVGSDTPGAIKEIMRIHRDGSWVSRGQFWFNAGNVHFMNAPDDGEILVRIESTGIVYPLDLVTWTPNLNKPFTTAITASRLGNGLFLHNRAGVLKYYDPVSRGYDTFDNATGTNEGFTEVYASGVNIDHPIYWVRDQVIAVFRDPDIVLWDLDTQQAILTSTYESAAMVGIDRTYGNLITIRASDERVQVWELEVEPAQLTFSAVPGNYDRYHTEALSVTVEGTDNELIEGVDVEWRVETVTAQSGAVNNEEVNKLVVNQGATVAAAKGKITPLVSKTNASGVATTTYCPPGLDWVSGDQELITATVKT